MYIWILLRGVDCSVILLTILDREYDARSARSHIVLRCVRETGLANYLNASVNAARVCCLGEDRRAYPVSTMSDCNGVRVRTIREIYRCMSDGIAIVDVC